MRAALVIKLVEAFHLGALSFRQAVEILADEESKKGNDSIAEKLMNALNQNKERFEASTNDVAPKNNAFFSISRATPPQNQPKDRDSLLSLFEIIEPSIGFEKLFFASDVSNVFQQIIREWGQSDLLFEVGMAPSRRILLHGPPGCGKTVAGLALAKGA